MKCAIYGAGSLGTVLGAYMTKNGVEVELVNRNKAHVATLNEKGAHITGTVDFTTPVKAITPDEMSGKYDVIFLMTKQLHNKEVVTFLKPFLTEDGVIATLQNGIPEPGIAEIVGNEQGKCTLFRAKREIFVCYFSILKPTGFRSSNCFFMAFSACNSARVWFISSSCAAVSSFMSFWVCNTFSM